jgi:hypothetical protein
MKMTMIWIWTCRLGRVMFMQVTMQSFDNVSGEDLLV